MANRNDLDSFKERVNLFFDRELNTEDENALMEEVKDDPARGNLFKKEKSFREYIKNNVKRSSVPPDLIQNIKDKIKVR